LQNLYMFVACFTEVYTCYSFQFASVRVRVRRLEALNVD
jgi:hypothetical protein